MDDGSGSNQGKAYEKIRKMKNFDCKRLSASIPFETCIARQTTAIQGSTRFPTYPECLRCEQGRQILQKNGAGKPGDARIISPFFDVRLQAKKKRWAA